MQLNRSERERIRNKKGRRTVLFLSLISFHYREKTAKRRVLCGKTIFFLSFRLFLKKYLYLTFVFLIVNRTVDALKSLYFFKKYGILL